MSFDFSRGSLCLQWQEWSENVFASNVFYNLNCWIILSKDCRKVFILSLFFLSEFRNRNKKFKSNRMGSDSFQMIIVFVCLSFKNKTSTIHKSMFYVVKMWVCRKLNNSYKVFVAIKLLIRLQCYARRDMKYNYSTIF